MTSRQSRQFDIVVYGATGFTGQLILEYLIGSATKTPGLRVAAAGRNKKKLQETVGKTVADLKLTSEVVVPVLVADSSDLQALQAVAAQTRVLISAVGPYIKYGRKVVDACVSQGTDYVDLTGEPFFIRDSIDRFHQQAAQKGSLVVHCCGFDSVPSDLGAFLIADHFVSKGLQTRSVKYSLVDGFGGFSGGTLDSIVTMLTQSPRAKLIELNKNLDYFVPDSAVLPENKSVSLYYDKDFGKWQSYFLMSPVNLRVVRRSNWFLNYGQRFSYSESQGNSRFVYGFLALSGLLLMFVMLLLSPTRWIIQKLLPPSSGPSLEVQRKGFFHIELLGESEPNANGEVSKASATVKGISDPGYRETSKMVAESALCLALDRAKFGKRDAEHGSTVFDLVKSGVATPASCMGPHLIRRLRAAGMTFSVKDIPASPLKKQQ